MKNRKHRPTPKNRRTPGTEYWVSFSGGLTLSQTINGPNVINEVVIDDWLHVEQMDEDTWWVRIGDVSRFVKVSTSTKIPSTLGPLAGKPNRLGP